MNDRELSRFWQKVQRTESCWDWTAAINQFGYGIFTVQGKTRRAHRLIWEQARGPIPEDMVIDHICHNRKCVNLDHLRLATRKQNAEHRMPYVTNTSGYRGVSWHTKSDKWRARIRHNNKQIHIGYFDDIEEAAAAAKAKRNELFTFNYYDRVEQP